jgi:hypothetical protein
MGSIDCRRVGMRCEGWVVVCSGVVLWVESS